MGPALLNSHPRLERYEHVPLQGSNLPSAAEAWLMVLDAPADGVVRWKEKRKHGWHIYTTPHRWEFPIVEKVARDLGWPDRYFTNSPESDRARFMNAYESEVD